MVFTLLKLPLAGFCSCITPAFRISDVVNVAGPRSEEGLSRGWFPKSTVNVFCPLIWMRPSGMAPGMQFVVPPQRLCVSVTAGFSS